MRGACFCSACGFDRKDTVVVGSKNFTEQAILGEIIAQQIESHTHLKVERRFYLAGSYICQQALLAGRIDTYVEYTGTALTAILKDPVERDQRRCSIRSAPNTRGNSRSTFCLPSASTILLPSLLEARTRDKWD